MYTLTYGYSINVTNIFYHILLIFQVRFYAAELILALEHIHAQSIVYRDLKVYLRT